jgi:hypothetical protein
VHLVRRVQYQASSQPSVERCGVLECDLAWSVVKTVEHGLEAATQLALQLWLLTLYMPLLAGWSSSETMVRAVTGAANFLTFDLYPACFLEKSLGKIALNLVSLSLGAAFSKVTKHGVSPCSRPLRVFPILTSYFLQIIARLYAFRLLLLLDTPIGQYKLLVFFVTHFSLTLILRMVFEGLNLRSSPLSLTNLRNTFILLAKFLLAVLSSSIVMVHIHSPDTPKSLFLSHASFFLLILCEHLALLLLSLQTVGPTSFLLLLGLWLGGLLLHLLHYTWAHPWASLNGPDASSWPSCFGRGRVGAREGGYKGVPALEGSNSIQLVGGISPDQRTYPEHSSEPSIL